MLNIASNAKVSFNHLTYELLTTRHEAAKCTVSNNNDKINNFFSALHKNQLKLKLLSIVSCLLQNCNFTVNFIFIKIAKK